MQSDLFLITFSHDGAWKLINQRSIRTLARWEKLFQRNLFDSILSTRLCILIMIMVEFSFSGIL